MLECLVITLFSAIVCICFPKMLMVMAAMVRKVRNHRFSFPEKMTFLQPHKIDAIDAIDA
jgi:hypothetical protein